jgi:hypothetical protein
MHPLTFLAATLLLTLAAYAAHVLLRRRIAGRVRRLAIESGMNYSETDCFQLTPRVAGRFPIPGASDVKLTDLIYRLDGDRLRYCFTVHYTAGVIRTKRRLCRAAAFSEPRDSRAVDSTAWSPLLLAPEHLPILDQYRHLNSAATPPPPPPPPDESRAPAVADAPAHNGT